MAQKIIPIIIAGGSGTRLWPLSRKGFPKQFINLNNDCSLLQETVQRLTPLQSEKPVIVCNEEHRFEVASQLKQINQLGHIILEPSAKNTAPAIALACLLQKHLEEKRSEESPWLLVLPADHNIPDADKFCDVVKAACEQSAEGAITTFGIEPTEPCTEYGYIELGAKIANTQQFQVKSFKEKPNKEDAATYLNSGQFLWNAGIFLFKAETYLSALEQFEPTMYQCCRDACENFVRDDVFWRVNATAFNNCPANSIDYAVMEHLDNTLVMPYQDAWSDLGTWESLWDNSEKDECGNSLKGDVLTVDARENYVYAEDRLVVTAGVKDLVVIETSDAVLVQDKNKPGLTKEVVNILKNLERKEVNFHSRVNRPWGAFESICNGPRFQVKRLLIEPGQQLSLQLHFHRSEHWVVVRGTAEVQKGEEISLLSENESIYIPVGTKHKLTNPGKVTLEIIEVQCGSYLGEDDIVRFQDVYGREKESIL